MLREGQATLFQQHQRSRTEQNGPVVFADQLLQGTRVYRRPAAFPGLGSFHHEAEDDVCYGVRLGLLVLDEGPDPARYLF